MARERAGRSTAAGLFLVCLATLVLEIGLTRVLSVTVWYHFSFAALSLALLGMSAGSVLVYVRRHALLGDGDGDPGPALTRWTAAFALTAALAIVAYLQFDPRGSATEEELSWLRLLPALLFVVPFLASGVVVSLVLTAYPSDVSRLYFWDLVGAGLGGVALVLGLEVLSGPSMVLAVAALGALAAPLFAHRTEGSAANRTKLVAWAVVALTMGALASNVASGWLRVRYTKSYDEGSMQLVHEKWSPIARLTVFKKQWARGGGPYGWGLSDTYDGPALDELWVEQDASAGTPITAYDGDVSKLPHLGYDVTSVVYHVLDPARVAVIGLGGGRDALTALHFGAEKVTGVEINPDMVALVDEHFADFAGRLYEDPRVEVAVADGRSFLAHADREFDLIQISLIDSWAASAAGAYVLAENSLYTAEAFDTYWQRLSEDGSISVSRWCMSQDPPELLRLVSLALVTLRANGVEDPGAHIAVVTYRNKVGTVILKRSPFTADEVAKLQRATKRLHFDVAWAPNAADNWESFSKLIGAYDDLERYWDAHRADVSPPTDDRPFFFLMLRLADALDETMPYELGLPYNATAVRTLGGLLVGVAALVLLLIAVPLQWFAKHGLSEAPRRGRFLGYFACLGLGFMLLEVPLIQKLILFLGHPVFALTVVLSTLLVASGVGARLTSGVGPDRAIARARIVLPLIVLSGLLVAYAFDPLLDLTLTLTLGARVGLSVALLVPVGLVLGMAFPLGVKMIDREQARAIIPWAWGVNGATSVLATVFAFVLAITAGYTVCVLTAVGCYALASAIVWTWR